MILQNFVFLVISYYLACTQAYITSDYGNFKKWYYKESWSCQKGQNYIYQIQFQSAFQNIPQVIISPNTIDICVESTTLYGYSVKITLTTTTFFEVTLWCDYNCVGNLLISWFALDDQRFEVFHFFNVPNPQTITQPHSNKNALYGFLVFVNYYAKNTVDYTIKLDSITETNYTVLITQTNLLNLGYSVILGPKGAFDSQLLNTTVPKSTAVCSAHVPIVSNQLWFFYPLYFAFPATTYFRVQLQQTLTSTYNSYCFQTWTGSSFLKFGHQCTTIYFNVSGFLPILMRKIRISKMESPIIANSIQFSIMELNKIYDSLISDQFEASSSITTFTFSITVICQSNQKVTAQFVKDQGGSSTLYSTSKYCSSKENQISFHSIFVQSNPQYQYFILSITTDQLVLKQKLINQQIEVITIAQIRILQQ